VLLHDAVQVGGGKLAGRAQAVEYVQDEFVHAAYGT
jgi:hypothetical protein